MFSLNDLILTETERELRIFWRKFARSYHPTDSLCTLCSLSAASGYRMPATVQVPQKDLYRISQFSHLQDTYRIHMNILLYIYANMHSQMHKHVYSMHTLYVIFIYARYVLTNYINLAWHGQRRESWSRDLNNPPFGAIESIKLDQGRSFWVRYRAIKAFCGQRSGAPILIDKELDMPITACQKMTISLHLKILTEASNNIMHQQKNETHQDKNSIKESIKCISENMRKNERQQGRNEGRKEERMKWGKEERKEETKEGTGSKEAMQRNARECKGIHSSCYLAI